MTSYAIVHGDDADGLTCGAFLKRLTGCEVYLANYDNLDSALSKVQRPVTSLTVCDLNIREALAPELRRIRGFAEVTIIDHHQMDQALMDELRGMGVSVTLDTRDCAAVLVYETFKKQLGQEAARLAAYAAISDMFEEGPLASRILGKMDRKFVQHEAQILTHALGKDQTLDFKRVIIDELSRYSYPHRIPGAVETAVRCLEEMAAIKETIPEAAAVRGRVAVMEAVGDQSTGAIANLLMDTLGVDVGISFKQNGEYMNVSLRGERDLKEHLGDISKELGRALQGFGGGHQRASGVKLPRERLTEFLDQVVRRLSP
ncbi:MAG: DHHA1 domain-containing protein [Candidatus Bathyarchaeota archaeon]